MKTLYKIVIVVIALVVISKLWDLYDEETNPKIEEYIIEKWKMDTGLDLGSITPSYTVSREIAKDSIMFKSLVRNSEIKVLVDGIVYKKDGKWLYTNYAYQVFDVDVKIDSLGKYFLDGSLVPSN